MRIATLGDLLSLGRRADVIRPTMDKQRGPFAEAVSSLEEEVKHGGRTGFAYVSGRAVVGSSRAQGTTLSMIVWR